MGKPPLFPQCSSLTACARCLLFLYQGLPVPGMQRLLAAVGGLRPVLRCRIRRGSGCSPPIEVLPAHIWAGEGSLESCWDNKQHSRELYFTEIGRWWFGVLKD